MQLLVTEASALSLETIRSQITAFRKITSLELDVGGMEELEKVFETLRK